MAITTATFTINESNVGVWTGGNVINQLESAFDWMDLHGPSDSGLIVGVSSYITGGGIVTSNTIYHDVRPISTTGIGTGASFYIRRSYNEWPDESSGGTYLYYQGQISYVHVNRPGYGYTGGEIVTISAEDIGGSANGATDLQLKVIVDSQVSNSVSYAVTFTGLYDASGTDRDGVVSGQSTTITIREGDTLTLTNNQASSYEISIIWNGNNTTGAGRTNRVFNVSGQSNSNSAGGITSWTPLPGQSGVYYVRVQASSNYSAQTPRIIVEPASSSDISPVSYGSTNSFYLKRVDGNNPYGILKHVINPNKKYGTTYRGFGFYGDNTGVASLHYWSGSGFFPANHWKQSTLNSGGHGQSRRWTGSPHLDTGNSTILSADLVLHNMASGVGKAIQEYPLSTGNRTNYQLDLNVFRSSIDPKFAVFSFKSPTLSSTILSNNTFSTFIIHDFETNLWDLNDVFLGGITQLVPLGGGSNSSSYIEFRTILQGLSRYYTSSQADWFSRRMAEFGFSTTFDNFISTTDGNSLGAITASRSYIYSQTHGNLANLSDVRSYYRPSSLGFRNSGGTGATSGNDRVSTNANFNAVIKGIPLNSNLMPVPYYIPDDFVLIDFEYASPSANIQQGDTITISGSEVYTVITGSYNQDTRTRGILFCARTV
jgi:hypothetical protein